VSEEAETFVTVVHDLWGKTSEITVSDEYLGLDEARGRVAR
jgi:hypothetical protein